MHLFAQVGQLLGLSVAQLRQRGDVCIQRCDTSAVLHLVGTNTSSVMSIERLHDQLSDVIAHQ
ncbi:hypothetical protein D3C81_2197910 [compost metagenome]